MSPQDSEVEERSLDDIDYLLIERATRLDAWATHLGIKRDELCTFMRKLSVIKSSADHNKFYEYGFQSCHLEIAQQYAMYMDVPVALLMEPELGS